MFFKSIEKLYAQSEDNAKEIGMALIKEHSVDNKEGECLREWQAEEIARRVTERMPEINRAILRARKERVFRRRPRDAEERKLLDILCRQAWDKALAEGKVKILNRREWYCEFD